MHFLGIDLAWSDPAGGGPVNRSGVVALEPSGEISEAGWTVGLEQTIEWLERRPRTDSLLFVDAPLVITNEEGARPADRQTGQRYGRWWVSANSVNLRSPRQAGVRLRERLMDLGWRYSDGREGPPAGGRVLCECYPYTTLVGVPELGYDDKRPAYKRARRGMPAAEAWAIRTAACDLLIRRLQRLSRFHPPVDMRSHAETRRLLEPSPLRSRAYKQREDLLDAVLCAWTAAYWHRYGLERCQLLGLGEPCDGPLLATIVAPARPEQRGYPGRRP